MAGFLTQSLFFFCLFVFFVCFFCLFFLGTACHQVGIDKDLFTIIVQYMILVHQYHCTTLAEDCIERCDADKITYWHLLFEKFSDFIIYNRLFSDPNVIFDKYVSCLNYFGDSDLCVSHFNKLKYSDLSMIESIDNDNYVSMLYPSTYAASIASRGYLIQHNQPIGEGVKLSNDYLQNNSKSKHHGGLKEIRENVSKQLIN